ncbi:TrmH family RNA methyltransferase [Luteimonas vadosa]|uniref:tRNA/rRNA methyltransferase n=1 Tax=Luteimonas vadosa TaxID=1165507 RepID=A0ABP9DUG2_9GAMM
MSDGPRTRGPKPRAPQSSPWGPRHRTPGGPHPSTEAPAGTEVARELRIHGFNAVQAVFTQRPDALRKLYLSEARIPQFQPLLRWCVDHRIGYRVVPEDDLRKLASSSHHEGVVADVLRKPALDLAGWLGGLAPGPQCALWLDGVGNPHNLGALLRSAAHFGAAVLLPAQSPLGISGAAARVAEGGAEAVAMVRMGTEEDAIAQLKGAGFALVATAVRGGADLFTQRLPERLVYVLGAEAAGMDPALARDCDLRVSIPGSGAVDSLNVSAAAAVLLAQWRGGRK